MRKLSSPPLASRVADDAPTMPIGDLPSEILAGWLPAMAGPRDLSVIEQLHLGDRCRLMVVKIRGEELLIGVTREQISILEKLAQ